MPYLTKNRFTFRALETTTEWAEKTYAARGFPTNLLIDARRAGSCSSPASSAARASSAPSSCRSRRCSRTRRQSDRDSTPRRRCSRSCARWPPRRPRPVPRRRRRRTIRSRGPRTRSRKDSRPGGAFEVAITGVAEEEWHVYSVTQGPGGPVPTTIAHQARPPSFRANGAIRGPRRRPRSIPTSRSRPRPTKGRSRSCFRCGSRPRCAGQRRHAARRDRLPGLHEPPVPAARRRSRSPCR